jgi:hypothetical protein
MFDLSAKLATSAGKDAKATPQESVDTANLFV